MARCHGSLGENHPVTLMAAANLALDELASGNEAAAEGCSPTRCAVTRTR